MDVLFFVFQQTMFFTIPLLIVALGGMFSERGGVVNIALEGIMIIGAFSGILFINIMQSNNVIIEPQLLLILSIIIAAIAGALYSLLHSYACINMKADQIIGGTALNLFAPAFAIFVARMIQGHQQINFKNVFRIESVPILGDIPFIGPLLFQNTYITTFIGFLILIISVIVFYNTKFGLRLRACGEHPGAADSVGINVNRMRYTGVLLSGILGGIGGLVFIIPTSINFNATVAGYGFLALAVLIFGQWKPGRILLAALFFGIAKTISGVYTSIPFLANLEVSDYLYKMIPYVATLVVLAVSSRKSKAPKALGEPYDQGKR